MRAGTQLLEYQILQPVGDVAGRVGLEAQNIRYLHTFSRLRQDILSILRRRFDSHLASRLITKESAVAKIDEVREKDPGGNRFEFTQHEEERDSDQSPRSNKTSEPLSASAGGVVSNHADELTG